MEDIKTKVVYIPTKVEEEIPPAHLGEVCCISHSEDMLVGYYEESDNSCDSGDMLMNEIEFWLKREKMVVFTLEEYAEHIKSIVSSTLKAAADNVEADLEPMGWLAKRHLDSPLIVGEDYEVGINHHSILELEQQIIKTWKIKA